MQISSFVQTVILFRPSKPDRRQTISTNTPKGSIRGTSKTLFVHLYYKQSLIFTFLLNIKFCCFLE